MKSQSRWLIAWREPREADLPGAVNSEARCSPLYLLLSAESEFDLGLSRTLSLTNVVWAKKMEKADDLHLIGVGQ